MTGGAGDDRIIGRALRWSLAFALGGLVLAGAAFVVLTRAPAPPATQEYAAPAPRAGTDDGEAMPAVPAPRFTDVTAAAGIDFVHDNGAYGESLLPETMGGGVAFFDADGDLDMDLLFVDSGPWPESPAAPGAAPPRTLRLYRNDGAGRFEDVSAASGLDGSFYGMGVATADVDGDGAVDVYATAVGGNRLYRNRGDGSFEEVTTQAGVAGAADAWSTGATFLDYDRDGDLDLFVVNYVAWSRELDFEVDYRLAGIGRAYGPPTNYPGAFDVLYRNDGDGRFTDVSAAAGVRVANPATGEAAGKGLAALALDVDDDGWIDLVVANDTVGNFLLLNRGDGTFAEVGADSGIAFDNTGTATGAMGIDAAWLEDADAGRVAIAIGNFANEMSSFYVAAGEDAGTTEEGRRRMLVFTDQAAVSGIGASSRRALTFGVLFLDYDLDGRQDLLQVNGHVEDEINLVQPSQQYAQAPQLYWHCGPACPRPFVPVPAAALGDLGRPLVGRGVASADIDGDGDLDLAITTIAGPPRLLRNDLVGDHHWLRVRLRDPGHANWQGIGARIVVEDARGRRQQRLMNPSRSYLSQVEPVATFGLGDTGAPVAALTVIWPDGERQQLVGDMPVDAQVWVERGAALISR